MPSWVGKLLKNGLPLAEKGCCCIELRKCCFIQGVVNFLESLLSIAVSVSFYLYAQESLDAFENRTPLEDVFAEREQTKDLAYEIRKAKGLKYVAMITGAAVLIIAFNSIFLIVAARKASFKLLNIYLYIGILAICLDMLCRSWALRGRIGHEEVIALTLVIRLVQMYFLYIVYSYYKRLKMAATAKAEEEPVPEQATPLQTPA